MSLCLPRADFTSRAKNRPGAAPESSKPIRSAAPLTLRPPRNARPPLTVTPDCESLQRHKSGSRPNALLIADWIAASLDAASRVALGRPAITRLLARGGPPHVSRLVVSFIVDPVQRVPRRWPRPHAVV